MIGRYLKSSSLLPPTVMVVDDDELIVESVCDFLSAQGHQVIGCTSATQAMTEARRLGSNLGAVIMDVMLGDDLGPALVEAMVEVNKALRVVYLSGYTRDDLVSESDSKLPLAILQKPCPLGRLASTLDTVMAMP